MSIGLWGDRLRKYIKKVKKTRKKRKRNKKKRKNKGRKKKGGSRTRKNNISKYLPWLFERKTRKRRK